MREAQTCEATGYKARNRDSEPKGGRSADAQGTGHGSDTRPSLPPPASSSSSPDQVDRGRQPAPTPTPAACCHHHAGNPAAGPEQARVPFGLSVPVSSLQKTRESQGRKQRKDRRREGGREGGKETEQRERRRRQEISASNPNNAASASRPGSSPAGQGLQLRCRSPHR